MLVIHATCTALYHSSGFFIIMSPAEGLHFSALVRVIYTYNFLVSPVLCVFKSVHGLCIIFMQFYCHDLVAY